MDRFLPLALLIVLCAGYVGGSLVTEHFYIKRAIAVDVGAYDGSTGEFKYKGE